MQSFPERNFSYPIWSLIMGLATLFAAPVFGSGGIDRIVKGLFVANGILGILTPIGYGLSLPIEILLGGLVVWDIVMPISTASLAILFRRTQRTKG